MPALVIAIIGFLAKDLVKRLLIGAGIGIASYSISKFFLNMIVEKITTSLGGLPSTMIQLLGLVGVDKCISIQIGAYAMAAAIIATRLTFTSK